MTVRDLLYKILEYNYLWVLPQNINSKPAKVRLSQIEILLDAFGLSKKYVNSLILHLKYITNKEELDRGKHLNSLSNIQYVTYGEFLKDREKGANKEIADIALTKIKEIYPDVPERFISKKAVDVSWMFNNLFHFREAIYKMSYPNGGMLEGFEVGFLYSLHLQKQLQEVIKNNLSDIDEALCLILDPQKRVFTNEEINYTEVDLEKIDLEWNMSNDNW